MHATLLLFLVFLLLFLLLLNTDKGGRVSREAYSRAPNTFPSQSKVHNQKYPGVALQGTAALAHFEAEVG
jgi:hypothetical protein